MKDRFIFYLKRIPIVFALVLMFLISVISFSSYFASNVLSSFTNAVSECQTSLYEGRIILGVKDRLSSDFDDGLSIKTKRNDGVISYKVGLNTSDSSFQCNESIVTPVESNLLRYNWNNQVNKSSLIQEIHISYVYNHDDFESSENNVVVSTSFYEQNGKPEKISIYSSIIDETIELTVVGVYNANEEVGKRVPKMFYGVYEEPMFFNSSMFAKLVDYENLKPNTVQTDLVIDTSYSYTATVEKIFNSRHWDNYLVRYDLFNDIFAKMNEYLAKDRTPFLIVGLSSLGILTVSVVVLSCFCKNYFKSLFLINPYFVLFIFLISLFLIYFVSKYLIGGVLLTFSSFGVVVSISVVLLICFIICFFFSKYQKEIKND